MAWPVYSQQFIVYTSSAPNQSYLVPENFVAVVRDITLWDPAAGILLQVSLQNSDAAPAIVFANLSGAGVPTYEQWQGRVVCPAGGTISFATESLGADSQVYVGGYLLAESYSR